MNGPQLTWIEVSRSPDRETVQEHALVLQAVGVPALTAHGAGGHVLIVRLADAERARAELAKFVGENRGWPPPRIVPEPVSTGIAAAALYAALLVAAFVAQRQESYGFDWWASGRADAALIQGGAWWRSVTALCLHADALHLAGNLVFGALFGVMLAQSVGSGAAWWTFVITGALGNWVNATLQSPSHVSVGASTAVFGMLGAQVAFDRLRRAHLHHDALRRWAPIVMGLALLAWLGGGDRGAGPDDVARKLGDFDEAIRRIDVGAHVAGFVAGLGIGALLGWRPPKRLASSRVQGALAAAAAAVVVAAWVAALRS